MKNTSYMEVRLCLDGKEDLYLRVPKVWDAVDKSWIGFIKTPKTQKLISAKGKNYSDLQNSFNIEISKMTREIEELTEEIIGMFMPAWYWGE